MAHFEAVGDNYNGLLPAMLRDSGFEMVMEMGFFHTIFGTLTLLRARKPA